MKLIRFVLFVFSLAINSINLSAQNHLIIRGNSILANKYFETSYGFELGFEQYLDTLYGLNAEVVLQFPGTKFTYTKEMDNLFLNLAVGPVIKYQPVNFVSTTLSVKLTYFSYSRKWPSHAYEVEGIIVYEESISNHIGAKIVGELNVASMSVTFGYDFAPTEIKRRWYDRILQKEFKETRNIDMSKWVFSFGFKFAL